MTQPFPLERLVRPCNPVEADWTIGDAARVIAETGHGAPVVDQTGSLIGFLDESDLLAALTPGYLRDLHGTGLFVSDPTALRRAVERAGPRTVRSHMRTDPAFIDLDDSEIHAAARFLQSGQHTLPAVQVGSRRVVGVIRLHDLLSDLTLGAIGPTAGS